MFIANSVEERNQYLDLVDWDSKKTCILSSVYLLVEYDNKKEPVCFKWNKSGWRAFSCRLVRKGKVHIEFIEYLREYEKDDKATLKIANYLESVIRNGYEYEIILNSKAEELPKRVIFHEIISDSECIDWFLEKYSDDHKKGNVR